MKSSIDGARNLYFLQRNILNFINHFPGRKPEDGLVCHRQIRTISTSPLKFNKYENVILKMKKNEKETLWKQFWEEAGGLDSLDVISIKRLSLKDLNTLKTRNLVDADVTGKMLSHLEPFPYDGDNAFPKDTVEKYLVALVLNKTKKSKVTSENAYDLAQQSLNAIQFAIVRQYYAWRLECDINTIDVKYFTCKNCMNRNSLQNMKETLDMLINDFNFTTDMILKHFYLTSIYSSKLKFILQNKSFGIEDFKSFYQNCPKILTYDLLHIYQTTKILKAYKVTTQQIIAVPQIFKYNPGVIQKNIESIEKDEKLKLFMFHRRFLFLVISFTSVKERLDKLDQQEKNLISLNLLLSDKIDFSKAEKRMLTIQSLQKIYKYIAGKLGTDINSVKDALSHRCDLYFSSSTKMAETLEFLLSQNFEKDALLESLELILYPKVKVEKTLKEIRVKKYMKLKVLSLPFSWSQNSQVNDRRLALCLDKIIKEEENEKKENKLPS